MNSSLNKTLSINYYLIGKTFDDFKLIGVMTDDPSKCIFRCLCSNILIMNRDKRLRIKGRIRTMRNCLKCDYYEDLDYDEDWRQEWRVYHEIIGDFHEENKIEIEKRWAYTKFPKKKIIIFRVKDKNAKVCPFGGLFY